jgi:capsid protein
MNQATGGNISEAQLLGQATTTASTARPGGMIATANGGTWPATQAELLTTSGVPAAAGAANGGNVALAMSQGRGAIANVDAGALWPTTHGINPGAGSWHAVTVTGVEIDDSGKIVAYHINDTGPNAGPNCNVRVNASTFEGAMSSYHTPNQGLVTTSNAIW